MLIFSYWFDWKAQVKLLIQKEQVIIELCHLHVCCKYPTVAHMWAWQHFTWRKSGQIFPICIWYRLKCSDKTCLKVKQGSSITNVEKSHKKKVGEIPDVRNPVLRNDSQKLTSWKDSSGMRWRKHYGIPSAGQDVVGCPVKWWCKNVDV